MSKLSIHIEHHNQQQHQQQNKSPCITSGSAAVKIGLTAARLHYGGSPRKRVECSGYLTLEPYNVKFLNQW